MNTYKVNYVDRVRYVFEVQAENESEAIKVATAEESNNAFLKADEFIMGPVISVELKAKG